MTSLPIPNPGLGNTANYCFVARWVSSSESADGEDISNGAYSLGNNVFNFNNFAQKNVTIVGGAQKHPVFVGNPTGTSILTNLAFDTPVNEINHPFTDEGYINIDLGQTLYAKWIAGGKQGTGIIDGVEKHKHTLSDGSFHYHLDAIANNNPYEIKIASPAASVGNLLFLPNELLSIALSFNYTGNSTSGKNEFVWDIIQSNLDTLTFKPVGGERYLIRPSECIMVSAGDDLSVAALCPTYIEATDIAGAVYTWRDIATGATVGNERGLTFYPEHNVSYEVEAKTQSGCISYDAVNVILNGKPPCSPVGRFTNPDKKQETINEQDISFNAFPNPFTDNLTVTYSLPQDSKAGSLKIMEAASGKLVYISGLSSAKNKLDIKLNVAAGLYICHIIADDGTSKQFKLVHIK